MLFQRLLRVPSQIAMDFLQKEIFFLEVNFLADTFLGSLPTVFKEIKQVSLLINNQAGISYSVILIEFCKFCVFFYFYALCYSVWLFNKYEVQSVCCNREETPRKA